MIACIIIVSLAFLWLGYETDWLAIRLESYGYQLATRQKVLHPNLTRLWFKTFGFYHPYRNPNFFPHIYETDSTPKVGYQFRTPQSKSPSRNTWIIELSPGIADKLNDGGELLCGKDWLKEHWADLNDYQPKVELYFGNSYKQTFHLKRLEIMDKIVKINTGKRYFKSLEPELYGKRGKRVSQ